MRYISPRFERITGIIDLAVYEGEGKVLFAAGFMSGLLACALAVLIFPSYSPVTPYNTHPTNTPITVRLVEIHPDPITDTTDIESGSVSGTVPIIEPSPPLTNTPEPILSEDTAPAESNEITAQLDNEPVSVLYQNRKPAQFTPYRDGSMSELPVSAPEDSILLTWEDTFHGYPGIVPPPSGERERWEAEIPLTENSIVFLNEGSGTVFWDPLNPIEPEPEDERRKFDPTFLGLPMGRGMTFVVVPGAIGFNAAGLLPSLQHFVKRMKWKYDDSRAEHNRRELEEAGFAAFTEQDIRFLILLWHYERLNPRLITRADREYLAGAASRTATTNWAYLEDMARRGLAVSLQKSGEIVYRAAVDREEMVDSIIKAIRFTLAPDGSEADSLYADTRIMLGEYLKTILSEYTIENLTRKPDGDSTFVSTGLKQDDHSPFISAEAKDDSLQSISD